MAAAVTALSRQREKQKESERVLGVFEGLLNVGGTVGWRRCDTVLGGVPDASYSWKINGWHSSMILLFLSFWDGSLWERRGMSG